MLNISFDQDTEIGEVSVELTLRRDFVGEGGPKLTPYEMRQVERALRLIGYYPEQAREVAERLKDEQEEQ